MKRTWLAALFAVILFAGFLAGYLSGRGTFRDGGISSGRKVLYYVDPMNPGHRSDRPGIAPCGMAMVPVYEGGGPVPPVTSPLPPGTVLVSPEKQQLAGIRIGEVEKASATRTLHLLGRVAPDERLIYFINATVDGWITRTYDNTTGSLVRKNQVLASYYSPEFLSAGQAFLFALNSADRVRETGRENPAQSSQLDQFKVNLKQYRDSLKNLGMGDMQIEEMIRTRTYMENVDIASPANGFVLSRKVSDGQRFDKGTELYRIADLRRVWILVDTYENEARYFRPGQTVPVRCRGRVFKARVSAVLPQFDPVTRTLKVRLEADNHDYRLRPDMFVDVEHSILMPPAVTVPADAVLDSGLKKTVFVDRGNGFFEPRPVETGGYFDDRAEIVSGLAPGERIVTSGNFLIDSESRMKSAIAGITGTPRLDPVCGHYADEAKSRAAGLIVESKGTTLFFCSAECKQAYLKNPAAPTVPSPMNPAVPATKAPPPARKASPPLPGKQRAGYGHD